MSSYPAHLLVRIVNPDTDAEYMTVGTEVGEVSDENFGSDDTVHPKVARYRLVGMGEVHHTAPRYVEDEEA